MATISMPARVGLWQRLQVLPLIDVLLGASAMVVLGSWLTLALTHVDDSYGVNHVSGVFTTLAASPPTTDHAALTLRTEAAP